MVKSKNESVLDLLISQRDENEYAKVESRMGIAVKIAKALKRKNMTQKELAEKLGKRPSEISKWLTGNHNFTHDTLFDVQNVLNIRLLDTELNPTDEIIRIAPVKMEYKEYKNKGPYIISGGVYEYIDINESCKEKNMNYRMCLS